MIVVFAVLVLDALLLAFVAPLAHSPVVGACLLAGSVVVGCVALAVLIEVLREWS